MDFRQSLLLFGERRFSPKQYLLQHFTFAANNAPDRCGRERIALNRQAPGAGPVIVFGHFFQQVLDDAQVFSALCSSSEL